MGRAPPPCGFRSPYTRRRPHEELCAIDETRRAGDVKPVSSPPQNSPGSAARSRHCGGGRERSAVLRRHRGLAGDAFLVHRMLIDGMLRLFRRPKAQERLRARGRLGAQEQRRITDVNEWQGFSVLVVDDDELFCSLLVSFCTRLGMPAQSVSHGSAFAAADLSEYDLLLLDLNMPGVDGVDIVQMIGDSNSSVGLVIISGEQIRTIDTVAAMARDAGLDLVSVLRKPVRFETFQEMLANWHARRRDRRIYQLDEPPIVELGMALEAGHVVAHFQPRADPMSMELVGVEAFARAPTLDGSVDAQRLNLTILQYPDVYELFSGAVQASALAFAETLRQRGMELRLTLNIAAQYLRDERLPERLRDDVLRHGVSPANVVLEMRAADLRAFANQVRPVLARLSLFGFEIALEDVDPLGGGRNCSPGSGARRSASMCGCSVKSSLHRASGIR